MNNFREYLQAKNINPSSIEKYIKQIEKYKTYASKDLEQFNKKDILDYLTYLQESKNLQNRTRQHILGILKHYYSYLFSKKYIATNPINLLDIRGTRKKILHKILTIEELNEFIDLYYHSHVREAREDKKHFHQRNYILLSLHIYQGLKLGEIEKIKLADIDLQKGSINILGSRKSNPRTLILQASQIGVLFEYIYKSRSLFNRENEYLFTQYPCPYKYVKLLKKIYPKFTDFKQIRASIITYWIQTEGLRKAQYKAGHRYISSTENYLSNDLESLKDDISQFHPL